MRPQEVVALPFLTSQHRYWPLRTTFAPKVATKQMQLCAKYSQLLPQKRCYLSYMFYPKEDVLLYNRVRAGTTTSKKSKFWVVLTTTRLQGGPRAGPKLLVKKPTTL